MVTEENILMRLFCQICEIINFKRDQKFCTGISLGSIYVVSHIYIFLIKSLKNRRNSWILYVHNIIWVLSRNTYQTLSKLWASHFTVSSLICQPSNCQNSSQLILINASLKCKSTCSWSWKQLIVFEAKSEYQPSNQWRN